MRRSVVKRKAEFRQFWVTGRKSDKSLTEEVNEWLEQFTNIISIVQTVSVDPNPEPGYVGDIDLYITVIYEA